MPFVPFQFNLRSKKLRHLIRYYSPHWRSWAATTIQLAWKKKSRDGLIPVNPNTPAAAAAAATAATAAATATDAAAAGATVAPFTAATATASTGGDAAAAGGAAHSVTAAGAGAGNGSAQPPQDQRVAASNTQSPMDIEAGGPAQPWISIGEIGGGGPPLRDSKAGFEGGDGRGEGAEEGGKREMSKAEGKLKMYTAIFSSPKPVAESAFSTTAFSSLDPAATTRAKDLN